ncbi:uncharacterized protein V1516DRAFT_345583 [Lipomyces oligophaga]|uniref:uncharacterized protein n=1 Tax=Lipomyces oligophaga TaxID=45792 RepID=UPI0034CE1744
MDISDFSLSGLAESFSTLPGDDLAISSHVLLHSKSAHIDSRIDGSLDTLGPDDVNEEEEEEDEDNKLDGDSGERSDVEFASPLLVEPEQRLDLSLTFPSKDALLLHLNQYAQVSGFRLSKTSSRPEHIRIQCWKRAKTSKYIRKDPSESKPRSTFGRTRSTGCPFFLNCWHHKKSGSWYIKSSNVLHNHGFSEDLVSQKSLTTDEKSLLRDLAYAGPELPRHIAVVIIDSKRKERGVPPVDPKLVSNTLARFRQVVVSRSLVKNTTG